jgi:hypothetical protein
MSDTDTYELNIFKLLSNLLNLHIKFCSFYGAFIKIGDSANLDGAIYLCKDN